MVDEADGVKRWARSFSELGKAMGMSKQAAAEKAKKPWFPARSPQGWDVDAVLLAAGAAPGARRGAAPAAPPSPDVDHISARAARVMAEIDDAVPREPPPATVAPAPAAATPELAPAPAARPSPVQPPPNQLVDARRDRDDAARAVAEAIAADPDRRVLSSPAGVAALDICRATMRIAARALATAGPETLPRAIQSMKDGLGELRLAEAGYLELAEKRAELIPRDVATRCMVSLRSRLVLVLERCEARLSAQVEVWLGDKAFASFPAGDRARAVRAWQVDQTRLAREEAYQEIEALVAEELAEYQDNASS